MTTQARTALLPAALGLALFAMSPFSIAAKAAAVVPAWSADAINNAATNEPVDAASPRAAILRAQVLLDRAHFSPGEIDGAFGGNFTLAIAAYQSAHGLAASGSIDAETWTALNADAAPAVVTVALTPEDVAGPFAKIPADTAEKAKLKALGYTSAIEALGEKYHASPALLKQLNPGKAFDKAGDEILVPNVADIASVTGAVKVVVDKSDLGLTLVDAADKVLARYPASVGSEHDPLPIGDWMIKAIAKNPVFHYNPALFWDADAKSEKATLAPGPNNPVGVVWMDLSKEHYGIHGTPEPSKVGKTESHGCIRLTNWNALAVAAAIKPGTPVLLQE